MDSNNSDDNHSSKTFYTNGVDKKLINDETIYHESSYDCKEVKNLLYDYRSLAMKLSDIDNQIFYLIQKNKNNKSEKKTNLKRKYKELLAKHGSLLKVGNYYNLIDCIALDDFKAIIDIFRKLQDDLKTL